MRVTIYHGYESDGRMVFGLNGTEETIPDVIVNSYSYEDEAASDIAGGLEQIFLDNNAGAPGGKDYPVKYQARSLSVGDIVEIAGLYASSFSLVASVGFVRLPKAAFEAIPQVTIENVRERQDALNEQRSSS